MTMILQQRRIYLRCLLLILLLTAGLTGCQESPRMRLAAYEADKKCPIELGSFGTASSVSYDDGKVIFHVNMKNEKIDFDHVDLSQSSELLVTNLKRKSPQFADLLLSTETGLAFLIRSADGTQEINIDIPFADIKKILERKGKDEKSSALLTLKLFNRQSQSQLPMKVTEGIQMTKVSIEDGNEIYRYEVDGDLFDMDVLRENAAHLKAHPEEMLNIKGKGHDTDVTILLSLLRELNMGLGYRYSIKGSDETLEILYTPQQIQQLQP